MMPRRTACAAAPAARPGTPEPPMPATMMPIRPLLSALLLVCFTAPLTSAENTKSAAKTKATEASALAVLGSSADMHEKARACQELAMLGGPASVSALAALLDDEHLSDYARSG